MSYLRQFSFAKKFIPGRQTFVMYSTIFCILSFMSLCAVITPSPAAWGGWAATYGGASYDSANCIQQTTDGGYIVSGWTDSFSSDRKLWLLKLRPDGTVTWQKTYGKDDLAEAESVQQTGDGGYIVAGWTVSFGAGAYDFWVWKLRPDGTAEWQKTYGGNSVDQSLSIKQTKDGGYIVAGATHSFGAGELDAWVLKLRADGTVEWQKTYGGSDAERAFSIQQTGDGGYILAGDTVSFGAGGLDILVLKLRPDGIVEWQKTYGGNGYDKAESIRQTTDGGYIVAGEARSFDHKDGDIWVLKLRADGTVEWQKTYGEGGSADWSVFIRQTVDGGYTVAGCTYSFGAGRGDLWILKLSPDGTVEWQKTCGGGDTDWADCIRQTGDGGYIALGKTRSFGAGERDILVLKLSPDGTIDPSCDFADNTDCSGKDGNPTILDAYTIVSDSDVNPEDSSAPVQDTDVSANILCASTPAE